MEEDTSKMYTDEARPGWDIYPNQPIHFIMISHEI
jgi:hypothetical protein